MELVAVKAAIEQIRKDYAFSERRTCLLFGLAVSTYRYRSTRNDSELRQQLVELARERPRFGYRRLHVLLGVDRPVNHKRVWRIYREAGLAVKRRKRKRLVRVGRPLEAATFRDEEWALDFVSDSISGGRTIRLLNIADAYTRECVALEVDTSFASRRVTRVLERAIQQRGAPQRIRCDNGPELTSRHFLAWCVGRRIELLHIQPGKPMQNGRLESLNGKLRDEFLNVNYFRNLFEARKLAAAWRRDYNEVRPHSALGYQTPSTFAAAVTSPSTTSISDEAGLGQGNPAGSLRSALTQPASIAKTFSEEGELT